MSDKPTSAAESIFMAALEIETAEERSAYVNESCGTDAQLLARVHALLEAHEFSDSFLEKPPAALEATLLSDASGDELAASLDAGLAPAFGRDKAVIMGSAGHSVLQTLGNTIDVPRVSLRESEASDVGPVQRPSSSEIPRQQADSRYQLQGEIARGGMGAVIKGRDTDLGRDLAIKVLLDSHKDKPEVIQRFVEEAQIGGQLQHPGIAPVYELGQFADQRPFFSMKLVKGQTLAKLLADREDKAEDRAKFLGIFEQVCQTMAYAHSRGVIHRDLKPANIMVGAFGEVQVMDWGLAKVLAAGGVADEKKSLDNHQGKSIIQTLRSVGSDTPGTFNNVGSQTQMGSVMGTPAYMPPEQALGEIDNMDERADVFGLGAILCEILTGKPPYVADDGTLLYRMASRGKLDDCFERLDACGADSELIVIAKKCLELEPADRPRDAGALSQRITEYLESVETRLRDAEKQRAAEAARVIEERKRRRIILASSCAVATLLLVIAIGAMFAAGHFREMERAATLTAREKATLADEMTQLAEQNQELADAKDHEAENARAKEREATAAKELAIQAQKDLRRELYLSDMQEVRQAYHEGAPNRAEELLKKYLPGLGEPDQRGWEWYYWWRANHRHTKRLQSENGKEPFSDLVVSPDESWFAIREWRDRVGIYDGRAGQTKLRTLPVGVMNPRSSQGRIAVSPDGRIFAAVSDQACVKLWSTEDWSELPVLQHHQQLSTIAFSSNGLLAAGDDLGSVTLWNTAQQTRVGEPLETGGASTCLAFSPDGNRLATGHEGSVTNLLVWDVSNQTSDKALIETQEPVKTLAWTRRNDRSVLAAGFVNGFVRLWDGETYEDRNSLAADGPIESLAFSPDGDRLVVGTSRKNEIHVWETETGRLVTTAKGHSQAVRGVGFTDDGVNVLSSSADGTMKTWELARSAPFDRLPMALPNAARGTSLAFSADSHVLWRGGMGGPVHRWDFSDPELLPVFDDFDPHKRVAFSANGRYTVQFTPEGKVEYRAQVYEINGADRVLQRDRVLPGIDGPPDQLAISDDGQAVAWSHGIALVWLHFAEGNQKTVGEEGPYTSLTLSPNGRVLTCARQKEHRPNRWGQHTAGEIWDVSSKTRLWTRSGGDVYQTCFSPDGALLAMATWEGLYVYATATGELRGQLRGHAGSATAVDFSRDGRMLVSGGYDGTVRLWDVDDQTLLLTLNTPEQNIVSVAFSPDGGSLASISESGDARLWRGGTEEMQGDRYWGWLADEYSQRAHDQVWPGMFAKGLNDYRKLVEVDKQDPVGRANNRFTNSAAKLVSCNPVQNASPDDVKCRFTLQHPLGGWLDPDFDDSAWQSGGPELARDVMRGWPDDQIWVRYEIQLTTPLSSPLVFLAYVDGKATVFVNGQEAAKAERKLGHFQIVPSQVPLQQGRNVIAVHCDGHGTYGAIHVAPSTLRSKDEILSLFAQPEAPLLQHAMIHQTFGNWDEAADCYVTNLQIRSQKPDWTNGLGWQTDRCKMLMDLAGQDSSFDVLRQQLPDAHYLWLARGRSLALRKQWQAAREAFSQYLALATSSNDEVVSLLAGPEPELLQHAKLHQTLGNWDEAAACHVEILQTRSKSPDWRDGAGWNTDRAKMLMNLVGSERLFDALRRQMPDADDLWLARGRSLAIRNKWQAAAEAFSRYLALASPSEIDDEVSFEVACCHLIVDDLEGYHRVANRFRELAGEKPNPFTAFVLARTAGLAPQSPELAKQAVGWGEQGAKNKSRPWEVHALGLALYRADDHDAAIARLSESLDNGWYDVANQLALALVYHDGGQHEQARQLLREAQQWRDEQLQQASDGVVQEQVIDWLAVHALLREAEEKIGTQ